MSTGDKKAAELARASVKEMIRLRGRFGYVEGLRIFVSPDLFSHMMHWCERSDWNFARYGEKWRGLPITFTRRLEDPKLPEFEFVKTWTLRQEASAQLSPDEPTPRRRKEVKD